MRAEGEYYLSLHLHLPALLHYYLHHHHHLCQVVVDDSILIRAGFVVPEPHVRWAMSKRTVAVAVVHREGTMVAFALCMKSPMVLDGTVCAHVCG